MKRALMLALAAVGWFALVVQFAILVVFWWEQGQGAAQAVSRILAYFTVLTNILAASSLTLQLYAPQSREGRLFASPLVASGVALSIAFVWLIYVLFLQHVWSPRGAQWLADMLLHYVTPLGYLAYWAIFVPKVQLPWAAALWWLLYPLAYLIYALARGALSGFYPYYFIDVGALGLARVAVNALTLMAAFTLAGLLLIALARGLSRRAPRPAADVA